MNKAKLLRTFIYKVLAMTWLRRRSFGYGARETFIKSKREWRCIGLEHVPGRGPYIVAANHFARVDDWVRMTGPQKMNDFIGTIGLINKLVEERSSSSHISELLVQFFEPTLLVNKAN